MKATVDLAQEATGEESIELVTQLILRERGIVGFDAACASRLTQLEVLSLSHNQLSTLQHFDNFSCLLELNLNFNQVTTLHPLQAPMLEKLFLSHNKLSSVSELLSFPRLSTLCLFRNLIPDLDEALVHLKGFKRLRALDLDGTPCSGQPGYKHHVIRALPRLDCLDEDHIDGFDREMAHVWFMEQAKEARANMLQLPDSRPSTAPSNLGSRLAPTRRSAGTFTPMPAALQADQMYATDTDQRNVASAPQAQGASLPASRGLEPDSIILKYAAEETVADAADLSNDRPPSSGHRKSSSVASAMMYDDTDDSLLEHSLSFLRSEGREQDILTQEGPSPLHERPTSVSDTDDDEFPDSIVPVNGHIDSSNGYDSIRKLLKMTEVLQTERAERNNFFENAGEESRRTIEEMAEELETLRIENRNMFILKLENEMLTAKVRELEEVRQERQELIDIRTDLESQLEQLAVEVDAWRSGSTNTSADSVDSVSAGTRHNVQDLLLEDCEDTDCEILRLMRRNEEVMEEIRRNMVMTKVELELAEESIIC